MIRTLLASIFVLLPFNLALGGMTVEGFESGDLTSLPWSTSGNANWFVTSSTSNSGTFSARSGVISHFQRSALSLTVTTEAGAIEFWRRTSTEGSFDFLRFFIDDVHQGSWSGQELSFTKQSFAIGAGLHKFEWRYAKDGSVNSGLDAVFIDDVTFPVRSVSAVPEPTSIAIFGLGAFGMLGMSRRNKCRKGLETK